MTEEQREAKRRAEVMLAFANGETIEATSLGQNPQWEEIAEPQWGWDLRDYRVKPKPKKPRQCLILIESLERHEGCPIRINVGGIFPADDEHWFHHENKFRVSMIELTPEVARALFAAGIEFEPNKPK